MRCSTAARRWSVLRSLRMVTRAVSQTAAKVTPGVTHHGAAPVQKLPAFGTGLLYVGPVRGGPESPRGTVNAVARRPWAAVLASTLAAEAFKGGGVSHTIWRSCVSALAL